jgi:hypothetical protein
MGDRRPTAAAKRGVGARPGASPFEVGRELPRAAAYSSLRVRLV